MFSGVIHTQRNSFKILVNILRFSKIPIMSPTFHKNLKRYNFIEALE